MGPERVFIIAKLKGTISIFLDIAWAWPNSVPDSVSHAVSIVLHIFCIPCKKWLSIGCPVRRLAADYSSLVQLSGAALWCSLVVQPSGAPFWCSLLEQPSGAAFWCSSVLCAAFCCTAVFHFFCTDSI